MISMLSLIDVMIFCLCRTGTGNIANETVKLREAWHAPMTLT